MASSKEYLDFVLEQLSELDEISSRAMMGEYILYYRGRVFGGIYDDRLLVKPVPVAVKLMPDAEWGLPYDGAKEMILVDDVDNREFLCKLVECMWEELPEKKKKKCSGLNISMPSSTAFSKLSVEVEGFAWYVILPQDLSGSSLGLLSFYPVATAWVGTTDFAALPTTMYVVINLVESLAFILVESMIVRSNECKLLKERIGKGRKEFLTILLEVGALVCSFFTPARFLSYILLLIMTALWIIPDLRLKSFIQETNRNPGHYKASHPRPYGVANGCESRSV